MDTTAPISLFVYNRPQHTREAVEALQKNYGASESELFVFSDGPKTDKDEALVAEVRSFLKTIAGFKQVHIIERDKNMGLAQSIIRGVTWVLERYKTVIVLEDDLVTSPYFLDFMNTALRMYRDEDRVGSISGYMYGVSTELPDTFFLRGGDCWGWATWRRAWRHFEKDGSKLCSKIQNKQLIRDFDLNGAWPRMAMLEDQIAGNTDSWAIRWAASLFVKDMLTLYPGHSLVQNIGTDGSGTHSGSSNTFSVVMPIESITLKRQAVREDDIARKALEKFMRKAYRTDRYNLAFKSGRKIYAKLFS